MNDRDCESCKMHEFTLCSATKYKDGTPIMSEPEKVSNQLDPKYCSLGRCPYYDKFCDHTLKDKHGCRYLPHNAGANLEYLEQTFTEFARTQDDLIAEYDETLKTHGDTIEDHHERITINEGNIDAISSDVEDLQRKVYQIYQFLNSVNPDFFAKIEEQIHSEPLKHNCNNFCGNCTHVSHVAPDEAWRCELSGEIVDPDSASCSLFDPSYASNPEWFENMKKTMTTPAEPTAGCKDCNCAKDGMCTKYNCSLGAICATPECFELPF